MTVRGSDTPRSGAGAAAGAAPESTGAEGAGRNWAGNVRYRAHRLHRPQTVGEVGELVRRAGALHVLGSRHSFTDVADSLGDLLSLERMERVFRIDPQRHTVTVDAGVRYGDLCRRLHAEGYALHNLASLPHISVAGACSTGTHGSGDGNGNLATAVSALDLVTAAGDVVTLTRDGDGEDFAGAVVGLGGLGVVTTLTLDLVPAFLVQQEVFEGLPLERLEADFDGIVSGAYSVSLFTDWQSERIGQVWLKRRVAGVQPDGASAGTTSGGALERLAEWFGAKPAAGPRHPIAGMTTEACTPQLGVPGPWYDRLPHFRLEFTPSAGEELQTEYLLPRRHGVAAIRAVVAMRAALAPVLQISEVRTVAADGLWLSPSYGEDSVALHFTWVKEEGAVAGVLPRLDEALAPFAARPHWGKPFATPAADLARRYPKLADFRRLLERFDPQGKLRNPYLERHLFGTD